MARIKFADDIDPLRKKHYGYTFQSNHYGYSMQPSARNTGARTPLQLLRMKNLQRAQQTWREMSLETQMLWEQFADDFPQTAENDPSYILSGYEVFIKRNHYCFLNFDLQVELITTPEMVALPPGSPVFAITAGTNSVDVTETYLARFGRLPSPGQLLEFLAIPYSDLSGQFFEAIHTLISVDDVYFDGLFLNIEVQPAQPNITYSVYLSKPISEGYSFPGTKVRYMGCFTTKAFLGLTDTPNSYSGQAGKVATVKTDETGLVFTTPGGGGLSCEDLPNCPEIININLTIAELYDVILSSISTSIPKIRFGYLYNDWVIEDPLFSSSDEWFVPSYAAFITWVNQFTTFANLGAFLKQIGYTNILYPNTGALNTSLFSFIAGGNRGSTGTFSGILSFGDYRFRFSTIYSGTPTTRILNTSTQVTNSDQNKKVGTSSRMMKINNTDPDGTFGQYIGNNGYIYKTVVYKGWEMTINNLAETKYRNGNNIPKVTATAEWAALTSAGMCAYNNDELYVF